MSTFSQRDSGIDVQSTGNTSSFARASQSLKRIREDLYETLANINGVELPFKKLTPIVLFAFEVVMWIQILLFCSQGILSLYGKDAFGGQLIRDIFLFNTPIISTNYSYGAFITTFYLSFFLLSGTTAIFIYNVNSTSDFLNVVCFLLLRTIRCLLFYPVMFSSMAGTFCEFSKGMNHIFYKNVACMQFPGILYFIIGFGAPGYLTLLSMVDSTFINDSHRSIRLPTATVTPRFITHVVAVMYISASLRVVVTLTESMNPNVRLIPAIVIPLLFLTITCVQVRMTPYYAKWSNFVFATFSYLAFCVSLTAGIVEYTRSPWGLLGFFSVFGLVFVYMLLLLKYAYIYKYMLSKYKRNLLCLFPEDVSLICFMSFTKKKHNGFTKEEIIELLTSHYAKSRKLCYYLIPIVLEVLSDVRLAHKIFNHANFDELRNRGKVWLMLDVDYGLHFFRNKIQELQAAGAFDSDKKPVKIVRNLNMIRKFEATLKKMYQKLFASLLLEEKKDIPLMLDTIESLHSRCENVYRKTIKAHISGFTYRKYADYLVKFRNDRSLARFYRSQADIIDPQGNRRGSTDTLQSWKPPIVDTISRPRIPSGARLRKKVLESEATRVISTTTVEITDGSVEKSSDKDDEAESGSSIEVQHATDDSSFDHLSSTGSATSSTIKKGGKITTTVIETSVIGTKTSEDTTSNAVKKLRKKIENKKFLSTYCFDFGILVLVVIFVAQVAGLLGCSLAVSLRFQNVIAGYGFTTLPLRMSTVQIPQGIQLYRQHLDHLGPVGGNESELDDFAGVYRDLSVELCESTLNSTRELFLISDGKRRDLITSARFDLFHQYDETDDVELTRSYNYMQAFTSMGEKCLDFFMQNDDVVMEDQLDFDDRNYLWLMKNQYNLTKMGDQLINDIIESLSSDTEFSFVDFAYLFLPIITVIPAAFFIIFWFVYHFQLRNEIKLLNVLSETNLIHLFKRFGGDENDLSGVKIDFNRIRVVSRFICVAACFLIMFFAIFISIGVIGHGVLPDSIEAISNLRRYFDPQTELQLIDFYAHELANLEISPFTEHEIVERIEHNLEGIYESSKFVQYGVLSTMSSNSTDVIFTGSCSNSTAADLQTLNMTRMEYLNCVPMTKQFYLITESANAILENYRARKIIDGSVELETLRLMDIGNVEESLSFSSGALITKLFLLITFGMEYYIEFLSLILNIILVSYSTVIPIGVFIFLYILIRFRGVMNRVVRLPRLVLLQMGDEEFKKSQVYDVLTDRLNNRTWRKAQRQKSLTMLQECLQSSSYPIVTFDEDLHITYSNQSARDLLDIHLAYNNNLEKLFSVELITEIRNWMINEKPDDDVENEQPDDENKQNSKKGEEVVWKEKSFRSEGEATYGEFTFEITVDISRNKGSDYFVAIIENVMSSKKKQILEVAEKRSKESDMLLRNILPEAYVSDLKLNKKSYFKMDVHEKMSAIFCDLCDFAGFFETTKMKPVTIMKLLHDLFSGMDDLSKQFGVEKIKTIGDCYFAVVGIPKYRPNHPKLAMDFSIAILEFIRKFNSDRKSEFEARIGIASGSCVAGIISKWKWQFDCWGKTINLAARLEQKGAPGKIHVSRSTYEMVFESYDFVERTINIKGVGNMKTYLFSPMSSRSNASSPIMSARKGTKVSIEGESNIKFKEFVEKDEIEEEVVEIELLEASKKGKKKKKKKK